jgi:hypothetical protein
MKYLEEFDWFPSRRMVTDAVLILLAGLIIRVHPDYVVLSLIAWASFIYAYLFLDEQWKNLRRWGPMILSLLYNVVFHLVLFFA